MFNFFISFKGLLSSLFVGFIYSRIIYHFLLRTKKEDLSLVQKMIGTVLVVASAFIPYNLIDLIDSQNTAVRFVICLPFVLFFFRTSEGKINPFGLPHEILSVWSHQCCRFYRICSCFHRSNIWFHTPRSSVFIKYLQHLLHNACGNDIRQSQQTSRCIKR